LARRLGIALKNGLYTVCVALAHVALRVLFRLRVEGRSNVSRSEGYIAVARHRSYWDIPMVAAALGATNRVHFIARKGLMKSIPLVQPLIRAYSTVIDREHFGLADFRQMLDAVRRKRLVFIFPEGTTRQRVDAKAGAVYFASATGKRILPINIRAVGPYPPKYPFQFPRVTVSIGAPIALADLEGGEDARRSEKLRGMSERLMEKVDRA
jgi:1-acyl-sn-glycerol-3-phosphate acyltransferase